MADNVTIKDIIKLKREGQELQELLQFYETENFELTYKCNHTINILSQVHALTSNKSSRLFQMSENLCGIMRVCNVNNIQNSVEAPEQPEIAPKPTEDATSSSKTNKKAHVTPHRVNGTELNIPSINLTRVPDVQPSTSSAKIEPDKSLLQKGKRRRASYSQTFAANEVQEDENQTEQDSSGSTPSMSPAHSTVLSGTFQEVKIFLSPIPDAALEESRKSRGVHRKTFSHTPEKKARLSSYVSHRRKT